MTDPPRLPKRKAPPPLLQAAVSEVDALNERTMRVRLVGDSLGGMEVPTPAASVRLLVPSDPGGDLVMPEWNGNEFLLPDGERPTIRTFTPLAFDPSAGSLELQIVRHGGGAVSDWAQRCGPGDPVAVSGPGSGWEFEPELDELLVFGDETAIPAITQLLDVVAALEPAPRCQVHIEVASNGARRELDAAPSATIDWHISQPGNAPLASLVEAARAVESVGERTHIWAAGEAAAMQAMRKHFLAGLGVPRDRASIRGYWKSR